MRFGSCYTGIGGSDRGLLAAGWLLAWQAERDSFRRAVLARRFGEPVYADVAEVVGAPHVEAIHASLPDHRLAEWWPALFRVASTNPPTWLICEFSPTVRFERIIRDLAMASWAFRLLLTRTVIEVGDAVDTRSVAVLLASRDGALVDGLGVSSASVAVAVSGLAYDGQPGTPEHAEVARGLICGWTCLCDETPCRCDRAARLSAVNDATPPYLTQWVAELIDGTWTDGRGCERGLTHAKRI